MSLQASYHQGHEIFSGRGQQCVANALTAIKLSKSHAPSSWDTNAMNTILFEGNQLYLDLSNELNTQYLSVDEIPSHYFKVSSTFHGTLDGDTDLPFYSLQDGIEISTREPSTLGCIFTMGSSSPSYSAAIIKCGNIYFFFDSHSRNEAGMSSPDGKATLTSHKNIFELCLFIRHLAASLGLKAFTSVPFEIASVSQTVQTIKTKTILNDCPNKEMSFLESSDGESDFSGFSAVSEGDYSCRLYLAENIDISDPSSIGSFTSNDLSESDVSSTGTPSTEDSINVSFDLNNSDAILQNVRTDVFDDSDFDENLMPCSAESSSQSNSEINNTESSQEEPENENINNNKDMTNIMIGIQTELTTDECNNDTPERKSRKRTRNEAMWKRNILKRKRNSGESYVTYKGKVKRARKMKPGCGHNCRMKCSTKITETQRENIFDEYWGLGDYNLQKAFINSSVTQKSTKRNTKDAQKNRNITRKYAFTINDTRIEVCKTFYINTLDETNSRIESAFAFRKSGSVVTNTDRRGKHETRPNKIPDVIRNDIKDHINSFPRVESHYCRKNSQKEYLEANLNLSKMYDMYKEKCSNDNLFPAKFWIYNHIFNSEFNIAFHKPLKDLCDFCTQYNNKSDVEKAEIATLYERHIRNKNLSRQAKETDKNTAKTDLKYVSACFDLQQVITLPKANQSSMYYSRKLNNYNLSLYSLGSGESYCYVWNETIANRGSCEVSSCVYAFLKAMANDDIKSVTLYSDNCGGQNRNRFFVSMLWYSLKSMKFSSISHKFLERGHTMNENDSVHSVIERSLKDVSVYTTPQLVTTIQLARRSKPYYVTEMTSSDFKDFKELATHIRNLDFDTQGQKIKWNELRTVQFTQEMPDTLQIKYDYDGPVIYANLMPNLRHAMSTIPPLNTIDISPMLTKAKYQDLKTLCDKNIIPKAYHEFYRCLPHEN
jgi:hypothetical protein